MRNAIYLITTDQSGYHALSTHRSEANALRTAHRHDRGNIYTGVRVVMCGDNCRTDIYPSLGKSTQY